MTPKLVGNRYAATSYDDSVQVIQPVSFVWAALGPNDDDVALKMGGVFIANKKQNIAWYVGETTVFPPTPRPNNSWNTSGFRQYTVTASQAKALGAIWGYGSRVDVFLFDGWSTGYRASPWTVTITFDDGTTSVKTGGSSFTGTSPRPSGAGIPNYYQTGPHFEDYYVNGSFSLTK